jgi:hypothetical protein
MDLLSDPLFLGLGVAIGLGVFVALDDTLADFAESTRWRGGVWALLCGAVMVVLFFPKYLAGAGFIVPRLVIDLLRTERAISGSVGGNWITSLGFVLGMVALTLMFTGTQQDLLLAIKWLCKRLSPILLALGFLSPVLSLFFSFFPK